MAHLQSRGDIRWLEGTKFQWSKGGFPTYTACSYVGAQLGEELVSTIAFQTHCHAVYGSTHVQKLTQLYFLAAKGG